MRRCLQLAQLGAGQAAPNPMVGAVLVYDDIIIGEGYHQKFGEAHAEVNCIKAVAEEHLHLIKESTLYVSLEPCAHLGKTPACTSLIIQHKIKQVIVACRDPFKKVNGYGIKLLKDAGIQVTEAVLEKEAKELNKYFFTFHEKKRPYIFLKWAQTADGFIAGENYRAIKITSDLTNRWAHQLRSITGAIMVGTHTAVHDNPALDTRLWQGKNPVRIVIDKQLKISKNAALFNNTAAVIVLNYLNEETAGHIHFFKVDEKENMLFVLMKILYERNIQSLIVEGGSILLQSFINEELWDEAMLITNKSLYIKKGVVAASIPIEKFTDKYHISSDLAQVYKNK